MIEVSETAAAIMASGTFTFYRRIESWKDGVLLDGDIPISGGTQTTDVTLDVPESATLTVPRLYRGTSYIPGKDQDHPLACWGQRLHINLGVGLVGGGVEWFARDWLLIEDTNPDGDGVTVTASGLLSLLLEAPFVSPVPAICNNNQMTFGAQLRKFVEPALHVDLSGAPADRALPLGTVWEDGRLDSLTELLKAWPADAYVNEDGLLVVVPIADTGTSSLSLTDGVGGTAMIWDSEITRADAANCVVARGNDVNGLDVQGVAYDTVSSSPTRYEGPFSALPVPYIFNSSLLTTNQQCFDSANGIMATRQKASAMRLSTTATAFLPLQARDGITVTSETNDIGGQLAIVDKIEMPLTADSGGMQLGVRLVNS